MEKKLFLYDTTLRDGAQGEDISFSLQDKFAITLILDEIGIDFIEGGYPHACPKDKEYFARLKELDLKNAKIVAFSSTHYKDKYPEDDEGIKALIEANTEFVCIFGKSWLLQVREVLRTTPENNLKLIRNTIKYLLENKKRVFYDAEHFFDGYRESPTYAEETLIAAYEAGCRDFILCDTNGGTLPNDISKITKKVKTLFGQDVILGIHAHNDAGLAIANTLAAVNAGATHIQGTINGYGERCGNTDLISLIPTLQIKLGFKCLSPDKLSKLTEISRCIAEIANQIPDRRQPYVGSAAFAHKGGIHASGVLRTTKSYEHIDPKLVGNTRRILLSELTGKSAIIAKTRELIKDSPQLINTLLKELKERENNGYQYENAEASFELLVLRIQGIWEPPFSVESFRVIVEQDKDAISSAEATIKVRVNNNEEYVVAEGDGPVHALDNALRKALIAYFPQIKDMHLIDYKVRVLNPQEATAAKVRVIITSADNKGSWSTIGISENIIEASLLALIDSFQYTLYNLSLTAKS
jgi:2-isopropylmalate synthase